MKTLYITDLDGTFLNNQAQVSAESARIITGLSREGALISVATARTPATVEPLMRDTYTAAEMVVMTGAALWNRPGHCYEGLVVPGAVRVSAIVDCLGRRGDVHPFCYVMRPDGHLDVYHDTANLNSAEARFVAERSNLPLKTFMLGHQLPEDDYDRTALFFGMGSQDAIVGAADELRGITDCYVSYYKDTYTPDLWLIEIFAPGVSKASGIERLRSRLGADRVVAFGDNLNDIPMLQAADVAVAVDNALPQTKAVADIIIGDNDHDAVARWIADDYRRNG
ncbi:MAG: HAD hydrolase family protein [Bacteroidales bacterium]|nr:HAD hydrolase family protein [Bacteroidales bacterium]